MPRISMFPGKDKPQTFTLTADTRQRLAYLAQTAGVSRSDFVEGLIRNYGPQLAADLLAAQEGHDANDHEAGGGGAAGSPGDGDTGEPVATAAAVRPARPRYDDGSDA